MVDIVNLKDEIKMFNEQTLPKIELMVDKISETLSTSIGELTESIDRLDGAEITIKIKLKE